MSGPVRITLPAKVAYDLNLLQSCIASIMERIGHPTCFSGVYCPFRREREFVINLDAKIERADPATLFEAANPDGDPAMPLNVVLAPEVSYDINRVQEAVAKIVEKTGHQFCFSG